MQEKWVGGLMRTPISISQEKALMCLADHHKIPFGLAKSGDYKLSRYFGVSRQTYQGVSHFKALNQEVLLAPSNASNVCFIWFPSKLCYLNDVTFLLTRIFKTYWIIKFLNRCHNLVKTHLLFSIFFELKNVAHETFGWKMLMHCKKQERSPFGLKLLKIRLQKDLDSDITELS